MRAIVWIPFFLYLQSSTIIAASTQAPPEREMLQLMEFLKEWEIIQELELMKQLENVDQMEDPSSKEKETPHPEYPIQGGQK